MYSKEPAAVLDTDKDIQGVLKARFLKEKEFMKNYLILVFNLPLK